ncbi:MAG: PTS sugar transporter subunit IIA [Deltaproteobacteria bacterium]|nr:PTS sugar transporter subunit IIA [Deltaproteobacteria bacterium]MBI2974084.1 PTS sugar transporter subunit IIA [Deltaproteobacteria bacterium]
MIGIVVVSHDNIAQEMVAVARNIMKDVEGVASVSIDSNAPVEINRQKIIMTINSVDKGEGVLLLSDMFGGTPSNLCLSFLGKSKLEVISGINLPMLIKLISDRNKLEFESLAEFIRDYGRKNIVIASKVLEGKIT